MTKKVELRAEERAQPVLRFLSKEDSAAGIARHAGIAEQTLYRWRDEFISAGKQALNGGDGALDRQLAERDQVIGELTIANRV